MENLPDQIFGSDPFAILRGVEDIRDLGADILVLDQSTEGLIDLRCLLRLLRRRRRRKGRRRRRGPLEEGLLLVQATVRTRHSQLHHIWNRARREAAWFQMRLRALAGTLPPQRLANKQTCFNLMALYDICIRGYKYALRFFLVFILKVSNSTSFGAKSIILILNRLKLWLNTQPK